MQKTIENEEHSSLFDLALQKSSVNEYFDAGKISNQNDSLVVGTSNLYEETTADKICRRFLLTYPKGVDL